MSGRGGRLKALLILALIALAGLGKAAHQGGGAAAPKPGGGQTTAEVRAQHPRRGLAAFAGGTLAAVVFVAGWVASRTYAGWSTWMAVAAFVLVVGTAAIFVGVRLGRTDNDADHRSLIATATMDIGVALVTGGIISLILFGATERLEQGLLRSQAELDENRFERDVRRDNVRFVRETVTQPNPTTKPFAGLDLSDADLSGLDLTNSNLEGATLDRADLSNANLDEANLEDASLRDANLTGVDLRYAILSRANLEGSTLAPVNLSGAQLEDADLSGTDLRGASLDLANMRGADLSGARLSAADFIGANLSSTDLTGVHADHAGFNFANLKQANLRGADLRTALFIGTDFSGMIVDRGAAEPTSLAVDTTEGPWILEAGADLRDADLSEASIIGADLSGVRLSGANMSDAQVIDTDMSGLNPDALDDAWIGGGSPPDLPSPTLPELDLRTVELSGATLERVRYDDSTRWPDELDFSSVSRLPTIAPSCRELANAVGATLTPNSPVFDDELSTAHNEMAGTFSQTCRSGDLTELSALVRSRAGPLPPFSAEPQCDPPTLCD